MIKINLEEVINLQGVDMSVGIYGSTGGILPKGVVAADGKRWFIKLGSYSKFHGFYGREPLIEFINSRIGYLLRIEVQECYLKMVSVKMDGKVYKTLATISKDFRHPKVKSVSFEKFYNVYGKLNNLSMMELIKSYNLQTDIYRMFVYDYIICNLDRHGKNIEVILKSRHQVKLAPLFDNSLTFLTNRPEDEIRRIVYYNDRMKVNNYIGYPTLKENLSLIDKPLRINFLRQNERKFLFQGLDEVTTKEFRDYVWYLLYRRSEYVRNLLPFIG